MGWSPGPASIIFRPRGSVTFRQGRPRRPKTPPRSPQGGPRSPREGPETAQEGPKTAQEAPKTAQEASKIVQEKPDRTRTGSATLLTKLVRERLVENVKETQKCYGDDQHRCYRSLCWSAALFCHVGLPCCCGLPRGLSCWSAVLPWSTVLVCRAPVVCRDGPPCCCGLLCRRAGCLLGGRAGGGVRCA